MLEVDVVGGGLPALRVEALTALTLASAGIDDGHLAVSFVDEEHITDLNAEHRDKPEPTDVLSFPVDEAGESFGPRELGDVIICPAHTEDLEEAVVHGILHLVGMDHETDHGEMLALQAQLLSWMR